MIDKLVGMTPIHIICDKYALDASKIIFYFEGGTRAIFYHRQECCEEVYIEDVNGSFDNLIGTPLLVAEERVEERDGTWTFYTFRSIKGSIDITWRGESNGYYSEGVDLEIEENPNPRFYHIREENGSFYLHSVYHNLARSSYFKETWNINMIDCIATDTFGDFRVIETGEIISVSKWYNGDSAKPDLEAALIEHLLYGKPTVEENQNA